MIIDLFFKGPAVGDDDYIQILNIRSYVMKTLDEGFDVLSYDVITVVYQQNSLLVRVV